MNFHIFQKLFYIETQCAAGSVVAGIVRSYNVIVLEINDLGVMI